MCKTYYNIAAVYFFHKIKYAARILLTSDRAEEGEFLFERPCVGGAWKLCDCLLCQ